MLAPIHPFTGCIDLRVGFRCVVTIIDFQNNFGQELAHDFWWPLGHDDDYLRSGNKLQKFSIIHITDRKKLAGAVAMGIGLGMWLGWRRRR